QRRVRIRGRRARVHGAIRRRAVLADCEGRRIRLSPPERPGRVAAHIQILRGAPSGQSRRVASRSTETQHTANLVVYGGLLDSAAVLATGERTSRSRHPSDVDVAIIGAGPYGLGL